jgi:hypothetical protein
MTQNCEPFENKIKIIKSYILDVIKYKKYRKIKHNIINIYYEELTSSSEKEEIQEKDEDELVIQEDEDEFVTQEDNDRLATQEEDRFATQNIPKIESISIYDKDYTHILDLNNKKSLCSIDIFPKTKYKNYIFRYKTKYYLIYELDNIYFYKKTSLDKIDKLIKTIILF